MDVAKFLDQPIRFNPRRPRAPLVLISSSLPPSASHESASPTPSLTSTPSFELDATLSSMDCFLPMQNPRSIAPGISSPLADPKDQILEKPKITLAKPGPRSRTYHSGQRRVTKDKRDQTRSACSACRRRKSKVQLIPLRTSFDID